MAGILAENGLKGNIWLYLAIFRLIIDMSLNIPLSSRN
jgi:hypothetical protein